MGTSCSSCPTCVDFWTDSTLCTLSLLKFFIAKASRGSDVLHSRIRHVVLVVLLVPTTAATGTGTLLGSCREQTSGVRTKLAARWSVAPLLTSGGVWFLHPQYRHWSLGGEVADIYTHPDHSFTEVAVAPCFSPPALVARNPDQRRWLLLMWRSCSCWLRCSGVELSLVQMPWAWITTWWAAPSWIRWWGAQCIKPCAEIPHLLRRFWGCTSMTASSRFLTDCSSIDNLT